VKGNDNSDLKVGFVEINYGKYIGEDWREVSKASPTTHL
jgi:hypothetical protein